MNIEIINNIKHHDKGLPKYTTDGAAAIDLRADIPNPLEMWNGCTLKIPTGIKLHINDQYIAAFVLPRSGLSTKQGILIANGTGVIDSDYQGEVFVFLHKQSYNHDDHSFLIEPGMRIAQLYFQRIIKPVFTQVGAFKEVTSRGEGCFGSTGSD